METTSQFWPNFWMAATALGTLGAVIIALFGGWLRAKLTPPKLALRLKDVHGEKTPVTLTDPVSGSQREAAARWYHIEVTNERRWSPAHEVQVYLRRIDEPDASGQERITWIGDVPLKWRHQEIRPLTLTVGSAADCDLCSVIKDKWVELQALITPHALNARRRDACRFTATVQARGIEADSQLFRVHIAWDGKWSEDTDEMARHMVVKQL